MGTINTPSYHLLACDLDGTLMGNDTSIRPRVQRAIAAAQAQGVFVTLATGRSFTATLPYSRQLNVTVPLICYQGGIIKHPLTGQLLYQATMERALVLKVIELAHTCGWHLVIYVDDNAYIQEPRHSRGFYHAMLGTNLHFVEDLAETINQSNGNPAKFIFVAERAVSDHIQSELSARFDQQMVIVRSHELFVEGNPLGVNKGDALRRLSEYLDVSQAHVMAIGDQGNDISMLNWAGLGVAMGSGSRIAQAAADWIAPPLLADGAAVAIERFLLS